MPPLLLYHIIKFIFSVSILWGSKPISEKRFLKNKGEAEFNSFAILVLIL